MSMSWAIEPETHTVVVSGRGVVDWAFLDQYLTAMTAMGTKGYRKLFDLTHAAFEVAAPDMAAVAASLTQFGQDNRAGPVAIVIGPSPLSVDTAVLLKRHVRPTRPLRIFMSENDARRWLMQMPAV